MEFFIAAYRSVLRSKVLLIHKTSPLTPVMAVASGAGTLLLSAALNVRPMESVVAAVVSSVLLLLLWVLVFICLDCVGGVREEVPGHSHQCIHYDKATAPKQNDVQVPTTTTTTIKQGRNVNPSSPSSSSHIVQDDTGLKIDMGANVVCYPNEKEPVEFENECCNGRLMFLCRTDPPSWNSALFEGRNHKFEIQIQVKLKVVPRGIAHMGVELNEKPKWGILTMTLARVVMKFASTIVTSMHYSLGGRTPQSSSSTDLLNEEKVHATFPLYRVVDRFVVTEEGSDLPVLGKTIVGESEEDHHLRVSGKTPDHEFTTDRWYTLSFYSCFIDFQAWEVVNIPGRGSLPITTFLGLWPFRIIVYTVDSNRTRHTPLAKTYFFSAEVSNNKPGTVGLRRCGTHG